ncbi:MAG: hypothetical protein D6798_06720, partial [Deltaproteobacteria bacterium]
MTSTVLATFLTDDPGITGRLGSLGGLGVMIGLAWLLSVDRRRIRWRPVIWGVVLQLLFGLIVLQ